MAKRSRGDAEALLEIQAKCQEWGAFRKDGWIDQKDDALAIRAKLRTCKDMEKAVMVSIEEHYSVLVYCWQELPRVWSTPLDRAHGYIDAYLAMGPKFLRRNRGALAECLATEVVSPGVCENYREPTFIVQLGRWAARLKELGEEGIGIEEPDAAVLADSDRLTVQEVADICDRSKGRITQLCNEGRIASVGKGTDRRASLISARTHFARIAQETARRQDARIARDARADARDAARDDERLGGV